MLDRTRRVLRTAIQVAFGLAAAVPLVEPVLGAGRTAGTYATILAVSTIITRLMHAAAAQPVLWWLGIGVTAQEKVPAAPSAVTPAAESGPSAPTGA